MSRGSRASRRQLIQDACLVTASIVFAIWLAQSGIIPIWLDGLSGTGFLGSFIAGLFFTSMFTIAPATVILGELAQELPLVGVTLFGGLGAACGDFILFRFVRDRIAQDLAYVRTLPQAHQRHAIFRSHIPRFVWPLLGALIIASPLPDELGILLMGLSRMNARTFFPISIVLNSLGILLIGLAARVLL